jgi:Zn finger protein HypA/HybF involved in hydrogenase expression
MDDFGPIPGTTLKLTCMECGEKFTTDDYGDPECPVCGSTDYEVG